MSAPKLTYTLKEAADALSVSTSKLYDLMNKDLPYRIIDGRRKVLVAELENWLTNRPSYSGHEVPGQRSFRHSKERRT